MNFNIPLERRKVYLDLFHQYGVKYIFAGHLHKNSIGWDRGLEMITTGPVGKPLGKDPSGFRIVKMKGNKITHQYFSLDSLPRIKNLNNLSLWNLVRRVYSDFNSTSKFTTLGGIYCRLCLNFKRW